jgi:hypothetical protein
MKAKGRPVAALFYARGEEVPPNDRETSPGKTILISAELSANLRY